MSLSPNEPVAPQEPASGVALRRKLALQYRARANWALGISIIAGVVVGVASWFIRYQRPMDSLDVKCSIGFGAATFYAGLMLFRMLFPKPDATCPQCGYAWEVPGQRGQDWLRWKCCPGCGLSMGPAIRELQALCNQTSARNEVDPAMPLDPDEKIFEAGDDCVLRVGKDYILCGLGGRDPDFQPDEQDKVLFKDLDRITVIRSKKSGNITGIDYEVRGKPGPFEISGYEPLDMEEIARLLESRAKSVPIEYREA